MRARSILVGVVVVACLLTCLPAAAEPLWTDEADNIVLEGWTVDGRFLVYQRSSTFFDDPTSGEGDESCKLVVEVVLDGASGERQEYLESMEGRCEKTKAKVAKLGALDAYRKWLEAHRITPYFGDRSPDKTIQAVITARTSGPDKVKGAWVEDHFAFGPAEEGGILTQVSLSMSAMRRGQTWKVADFSAESAGNLNGEVRVAWSPDNRRAAWVLHRGYAMLNDFGFARLAVTAAAGPRIELLGAKKVLDAARARVEAALDKGGFVIVRAGEAVKERPKSVVYAAKGQEDAARQVAALVPGGATVEALTWKAFGDLVIALGDSAAK